MNSVYGLALVIFFSGCSSSQIQTHEVSINAREFLPNGREPLMPPGSTAKRELNLGVKTNFVRFFYWDNKIWSQTDQAQFRLIGWNYKIGIRLTPMLDCEYEHFSKHRLDTSWPGGYPVSDSVGINFYLIRGSSNELSVFRGW